MEKNTSSYFLTVPYSSVTGFDYRARTFEFIAHTNLGELFV
jgi:hypothetical protein